MIRLDIKQYVIENNINLNNLCVQEKSRNNYLVCYLENFDKPFIWNKDNNLIMDYFYEDKADITYIDLKEIDSKLSGYFLNSCGDCIGIKGNKLTINYDLWGYPQVKINGSYKKVHKLLASVFIPNIDKEKTVVDHIDSNKVNNSLTNLQWLSVADNIRKIYRPKWVKNLRYFAYLDKNKENLYKIYTDEEVYNLDNKYAKKRIKECSVKGYSYLGYYWNIEDVDVTDYLLNICNTKVIDDSLWKLHYSGKFYVHPLGLIKYENTISVGSITGNLSGKGSHPERRYNTRFSKTNRVHIIISEVFLNNNKPIEKGLTIDHINCNSLDNRVVNLRICTHKENMNNPKTKEKLSRKVMDNEGRLFNSLTECGNYYKISATAVRNRIIKGTFGFCYVD